MIKELPILFQTEMVKATLERRKIQTRRMKGLDVINVSPGDWRIVDTYLKQLAPGQDDYDLRYIFANGKTGQRIEISSPYGRPGDRLWVRETWLPDPPRDFDGAVMFDGTFPHPLHLIPTEYQKPQYCIYKAPWEGAALKYHPAIHMPRWASRITLDIVTIKIERLQNIKEHEAKAEGASRRWRPGDPLFKEAEALTGPYNFKPAIIASTRRLGFRLLWDSINAKRGFSWEFNPWVSVITYMMKRGRNK